MRALYRCHATSTRKHVEREIVRPLRLHAELVAMRADSLRYLSGQLARVERLLIELPEESLTADELLTLSNLVTRIKQSLP
jgi:hypothetical protein